MRLTLALVFVVCGVVAGKKVDGGKIWKDNVIPTATTTTGHSDIFRLKHEEYEYDDEEDIDEAEESHPNSVLPLDDTQLTTTTTTETAPAEKKKKQPLDPNRLPEFVLEPVDSFIIRGKSAELTCSVKGARKAYFSCNGEAMAELNQHSERDSANEEGEVVKELRLEVSRNMVEEFFGQFSCQCDAWAAKGMVNSKNVTVETAYLRKEFEVPPYSQSVELGSQIELRCHPPVGKPKPRIYWMKDRVEVQPERDANYILASDGHLIIIQAREMDAANFTCVAENVAGTRLSPPARLQVVVTGGWSSWTSWSDCSSSTCGGGGGFQRRERFCNNPRPRLGGAYCLGPPFQKNKCTLLCKGGIYDPNTVITAVSGGWSDWSDWSTCGSDCAQNRRRLCDNPSPSNGGADCKGGDQMSEDCSGGFCTGKPKMTGSDGIELSRQPTIAGDAQGMVETDFSLLVGLSVALVVFLVVTLTSIRILRKKGRSPSMYTMTNLNYRREFSSSDAAKDSNDDESAKQQLLLETNLNSAAAIDSSPFRKPNAFLPPPDYHHRGSPFDRKRLLLQSSALTLTSNLADSPQLMRSTNAPPSPSASEHQYDIPFSHLQRISSPNSEPDYDERRQQQPRQHLRSSHTSSKGSSESARTSNEATLMQQQPRLIDGCSPLLRHKRRRRQQQLQQPDTEVWSGSENSTSIYSECSPQPFSPVPSTANLNIDPESFVYGSVDRNGLRLGCLGVTLTIPEGAIENSAEEVFLAVMTEGPRLSPNQTLLSPVVLVGPPGLSFKKPVVLSFGHCANLKSDWELGIYHCDSLFSDDDTPWVKLVTVGQESMAAPILASLQLNNCCIMTDFLTRYCIVGQSGSEGNACKMLRVLLFGKMSSNGGDFHLSVQMTEDTLVAQEKTVRFSEKSGFFLLEKPRLFPLQDNGGDIRVTLTDCITGWSLKAKSQQQNVAFNQIWSSGSGGGGGSGLNSANQRAKFRLRHIDPSVSTLAFTLSVCQQQQQQTFSVNFDVNTQHSVDLYSSLSIAETSEFKLPSTLRERLCLMLDHPQSGQNDWRALSAGLRLERFAHFFASRWSPTGCILSLWEVQKGTDALEDLLELLGVIGRQDCARVIQEECDLMIY